MTRQFFGWLACAGAVALLVVAMVTGVAPASAAPAGQAQAARVADAWVRLAAVPGRPAAGYFELTARDRPVEVTAVAAPGARVELHSMSMAGGVMRMDRLPSVRAVAGERVRFAPGGTHLMLFDVPAGVRPGSTLPLTFTFSDGSVQTVAAAVVAAGAAPPTPGPHGAH